MRPSDWSHRIGDRTRRCSQEPAGDMASATMHTPRPPATERHGGGSARLPRIQSGDSNDGGGGGSRGGDVLQPTGSPGGARPRSQASGAPAVLWVDASASLAKSVAAEVSATHAGLQRAGVEIGSFVDEDGALAWGVQNVMRLVCVCVQLESKQLLRTAEQVVELVRKLKGLGASVIGVQITASVPKPREAQALRISEEICQAEGLPLLRDARSSMQKVMELVASSYAFVDGRLQRVSVVTDDAGVRPAECAPAPEPELPPGTMPFDSVYESAVYPTAPPFNPAGVAATALRKVVPPAFEALSKGRATGAIGAGAATKRGKLPPRLVVNPAEADHEAKCQSCKKLSQRLHRAQCEVDAYKLRVNNVVAASNQELEGAPAGSAAAWDRHRGKRVGGRTSTWLRKGERAHMEDKLKDKEDEIESLAAKIQLLVNVAQAKASSKQERDWLSEQMTRQATGAEQKEAKLRAVAAAEKTALMLQIQQKNDELEAVVERLEKEQRAMAKSKLKLDKQKKQIAALQETSSTKLLNKDDENVQLAQRAADAEDKAEMMSATVLGVQEALAVEVSTVHTLLRSYTVDSASVEERVAYLAKIAQMDDRAVRAEGDRIGVSWNGDGTVGGTGPWIKGTTDLNVDLMRARVKQQYLIQHVESDVEKVRSATPEVVEPEPDQPQAQAQASSSDSGSSAHSLVGSVNYVKVDGQWVPQVQPEPEPEPEPEPGPEPEPAPGADPTLAAHQAVDAEDTDTGSDDEGSVAGDAGGTILLSLGGAMKARSGASKWLLEARATKAQQLAEALLLESQQARTQEEERKQKRQSVDGQPEEQEEDAQANTLTAAATSLEQQERYRDVVNTRARRVTKLFVPIAAQDVEKGEQDDEDEDKDEDEEDDEEKEWQNIHDTTTTTSWLQGSAVHAAELAAHLAAEEVESPFSTS
jgi:hypothetical protein